MKVYQCDQLNSLLDQTYKTIAEKESNKISSNSHLNVTNAELHMIEAIAAFGKNGCTVTELANRLSNALPSVTVGVNKLLRKGFVCKSRAEEDKRELRITLTPRGNKLNTVHLYLHHRISREIAKSFTPEEQEILIRGLTRINEFFRKELYSGTWLGRG